MLKIDRLRLSLPSDLESRATRIAFLVADELAGRVSPAAGEIRLEHLALPPVAVPRGASDRQVASAVAAAIGARLKPGARSQ